MTNVCWLFWLSVTCYLSYVDYMEQLEFFKRPLAFTDLETTGLFAQRHEIIELGLVLVDQETLDVLDEMNVKVRPEHIETADAKALEVNGYKEEEWKDAQPLDTVMREYAQKVPNAIPAGWNVQFDVKFLEAAFLETDIENPMDYHIRDVSTLAAELFRTKGLGRLKMKYVSEFLGITPEPEPHRAINGARMALTIYEHLRKEILA